MVANCEYNEQCVNLSGEQYSLPDLDGTGSKKETVCEAPKACECFFEALKASYWVAYHAPKAVCAMD